MRHPDLKRLFENTLDLSTKVLKKGDLVPTAAIMDPTGDFTWNAAPGNFKEAFQLFGSVLCRQRDEGNLRASCVALDVLFNPPGESGPKDAVLFLLEHQDGEAVIVHQVYEKKLFRGLKLGGQFEEPMPEQMKTWTHGMRDSSTAAQSGTPAEAAAKEVPPIGADGEGPPRTETSAAEAASHRPSPSEVAPAAQSPEGATAAMSSGERRSALRALLILGLLFGIPVMACVLLLIQNRTLQRKLTQTTALATEQGMPAGEHGAGTDGSLQGTNELFIVSAVHGSGKRFTDVTEQVRKLLQDPDAKFAARPKTLKSDPTPGWNKELIIVYEFQGKRRLFLAGEGAQVSAEKLKEAVK